MTLIPENRARHLRELVLDLITQLGYENRLLLAQLMTHTNTLPRELLIQSKISVDIMQELLQHLACGDGEEISTSNL